MTLKEYSEKLDALLEQEYAAWKNREAELLKEMEGQSKILASAEAKTDRSENAVFQIAQDTLNSLITDKRMVEEKLAPYITYRQSLYIHTGKAMVGSTCRILCVAAVTEGEDGMYIRKKINKEFIVKLVPAKADFPSWGIIGMDSKLGQGLLNKQPGDTFLINTQIGKVRYDVKEVY